MKKIFITIFLIIFLVGCSPKLGSPETPPPGKNRNCVNGYVNFECGLNVSKSLTIIGNETGFITFDEDGWITLNGTALGFDDIVMPGNDLTATGTSDPTRTQFRNNTFAWQFSGTQLQRLGLQIQLPHSRLPYSNIYMHLHFSSNVPLTNNTYIRWCHEFTCANIGEAYPPSQLLCSNTNINRTDAYIHYMTPQSKFINNLDESSVCFINVYREGNTDSNNNPVFLSSYDWHIFTNRPQGNRYNEYDNLGVKPFG
jgi:hypothetical protein